MWGLAGRESKVHRARVRREGDQGTAGTSEALSDRWNVSLREPWALLFQSLQSGRPRYLHTQIIQCNLKSSDKWLQLSVEELHGGTKISI